MSLAVLLLLLLFQFKHLICDYILQVYWRWPLGKFSQDGKVWVPSLAWHSAIQGAGTAFVAALWGSPWSLLLALSMVDTGTHFMIDRVKASPSLLGRWGTGSPHFWATLGLDQFAHHCVGLWIAYMLVRG